MSDNQIALRQEMTFTDVERMADAFAKSRLFPSAQTKENAVALMMLCQAEGLHPAQAVRRYHVIKGTVAMRSDAMLAEFQARGGRVKWIKSDAEEARAVFSHLVGGEFEYSFTIAEARQAGLVEVNPNWKKYPAAQLRARCVSGGIRMILPGIVTGIYTPEEVQDFGAEAPAGGGIDAALAKKARKVTATVVEETKPEPTPEPVKIEITASVETQAPEPAKTAPSAGPAAQGTPYPAAVREALIKTITDLRGKHKIMTGMMTALVKRAIGAAGTADPTTWSDDETVKVHAEVCKHCGVTA